jgi:hypothetical protein
LRSVRDPDPTIVCVAAVAALAFITAIVDQRNRANSALAAAKNAADDAERAQGIAEEERDSARLAQASLLLPSDPTLASSLLASSRRTPAEALVLARAADAGTSPIAVTIAAPRIMDFVADDGLERALLIGSDHRARIVDLRTGNVHLLPDNVAEPSSVSFARGRWWISVMTADGPAIASVPSDGGAALYTPSPVPTPKLVPRSSFVYSDGTLYEAAEGFRTERLEMATVAATDDGGYVACLKSGAWILVEHDAARPIGRCPERPSGTLARGESMVTWSDNAITVRASSRITSLSVDATIAKLALSPHDGTIAGYTDVGVQFFGGIDKGLTTGTAHDSDATSVASDGTLAAWGFKAGAVVVLDRDTHQRRALQTGTKQVVGIRIDASSRRVLTVQGDSAMVWTLGEPQERPDADLGCHAFNIVRAPRDMSSVTRFAADCSNGQVRVFTRRGGEVVASQVLHSHDTLAFGVTWRNDDEVCSSSWDGQVLCSQLSSSKTRVVARRPAPVRWITSSESGVVAYIAANGEIWVDDGVPRLVVQTKIAEPYRLDFNDTGTRLAAALRDGTVIISSIVDGDTISVRAHTGSASAVTWDGDVVLSSGADGAVMATSPSAARPVSIATPGGSLALLKHARGSICAVRNVTQLWVRTDAVEFVLDVGAEVSSLALRDDGTALVAGTGGGELIYLDGLDTNTPRIAARAASDQRIPAIALEGDAVIAGNEDHNLFIVEVSHFAFVRVETLSKRLPTLSFTGRSTSRRK